MRYEGRAVVFTPGHTRCHQPRPGPRVAVGKKQGTLKSADASAVRGVVLRMQRLPPQESIVGQAASEDQPSEIASIKVGADRPTCFSSRCGQAIILGRRPCRGLGWKMHRHGRARGEKREWDKDAFQARVRTGRVPIVKFFIPEMTSAWQNVEIRGTAEAPAAQRVATPWF